MINCRNKPNGPATIKQQSEWECTNEPVEQNKQAAREISIHMKQAKDMQSNQLKEEKNPTKYNQTSTWRIYRWIVSQYRDRKDLFNLDIKIWNSRTETFSWQHFLKSQICKEQKQIKNKSKEQINLDTLVNEDKIRN